MKVPAIYTVYFILVVCLTTHSAFAQKKYPTADMTIGVSE